MLDGELVALDKNGVPRFNLLQNYRSGSAHLMYFAFDITLNRYLMRRRLRPSHSTRRFGRLSGD